MIFITKIIDYIYDNKTKESNNLSKISENATNNELIDEKKNIINESDYIIEIINLKFKGINILKKEYNNTATKIFELIKLKDTEKLKLPSDYFDCIVLGGGLKGYYVYGSLILLKKMMEDGVIKIRKFIGISAGAFLSVFIFSNIDPKIIININKFAIKNNSTYTIDKIMLKICWELLPNNIHELINGKVSILISKSLLAKNREQYIDNFDSKLHLMQVLHATCYFPFVTTNNFKGVSIKGSRYYDGVFSNYNPTTFENDIPQLVFHTMDVDYPLKNTINFNDLFPEIIITRGLLEFEKFIKNLKKNKFEQNKKIPIKWIDTFEKINKLNTCDSIYSQTKIPKVKKHNHINEYLHFKNKIKYNKYYYTIIYILLLTISEIMSLFYK